MRKLLLTMAAFGLLSTPALADNIALSAFVDGSLVTTAASPDGSLTITQQAFGPDYNLNSLSVSTQQFLAPPGIINTNTLNVDQQISGSHQLVIDIVGQNLTGPGALQSLLSEFSVTGLTTGWTASEQTLINGAPLSLTPLISTNSFAQDSIVTGVNLTNPFSAEVIYTINSNGVGQFNGGIDINAVPGPVVGAGIPGLLGLCLLGLTRLRRRMNKGKLV